MAKNDLEMRTKRFALDIVDLVERMPKNRAGEVIGRQLLKAGTSIGANYREANRAVSRGDFVHKVGISSKEASETAFWLELILDSPHLQADGAFTLLEESRELLAILTTIGRKAKLSDRP